MAIACGEFERATHVESSERASEQFKEAQTKTLKFNENVLIRKSG
jgi:hypothetical protein